MSRPALPSRPLPWSGLAPLRRHRTTRLALLGVLVVPLLYGALSIWATGDPTGRLDRVQAAVVNTDEIVEITAPDGTTQPVAVGRLLAANLIRDDAPTNYDWVLTDAQEAERGLAAGDYQAVLTIPENLSRAATSTTGDPADAVQGRLHLRTDDAVSHVNATIARTVVDAARQAINAQVTEAYLDQVYLSFADLRIGLGDAAEGAGRVAAGARELTDGAGQLASGTGALAGGSDQLASGAGRLADGSRRLADGSGSLAGGLAGLQAAVSSLPGDSRRLADGARQVADGTARMNDAVQRYTGALAAASTSADTQVARLRGLLADITATCRGPAVLGLDCSVLRAATTSAGDLAAVVTQAGSDAAVLRAQSQQLAEGAALVAAGNEELAARAPELVGAVDQATAGAAALAAGTHEVAGGAARLADGSTGLAGGAAQAASGATALAAGAATLTGGTTTLHEGLLGGRVGVPDYDEEERASLARAAATPLLADAERRHAVVDRAEALAPTFLALALWVGAMAVYLLLRPLSDRAIVAGTGSLRAAVAGLLPALALAAGQAVLLALTVELVVGVDPASRSVLWATALVTALTFTAVNQACLAWFGGAGRLVALVLVSVQLAAAGGTYPVETAPAPWGTLHGLLPMSYAVDAFRAATAGGTQGVAQDLLALLTFTALALAATTVAAHRRQQVTPARLHPVGVA